MTVQQSEVQTNEPVAWRWRVKDSPFRTHEWCLSPHCPAEFNRWDIEWEPLFATAAQAPTNRQLHDAIASAVTHRTYSGIQDAVREIQKLYGSPVPSAHCGGDK